MSALRAPAVHIENPESPALPLHYRRRGGLRLVHPYHFDFVCNVKLRWHGMSIVDIFSREFPARPRSYYEEALRDGRLRVEGEQGLTAATPVHQGQTMRHLIHRHEPPVLDLPIPVLGETTDVVAVGKPPTLPVHVSGQYRKNTVLAVLQAERPDLGTLLPVHRLDKAVSGVLLFARSPQAADDLRRRIEGRSMEKVYVARVLGEFPSQPVHANVALFWDPVSNHVTPALDGPKLAPADGAAGDDSSDSVQRGEAAAAVAVAAAEASGNAGAGAAARQLPGSSRTGQEGQLWQQPKGAKAALTRFRRLAVASDRRTSLVECRPVTGRTHQIRVHLQYLGHPIANDAQYGGIYKGPDRPSAFAIEDRQGGDSHQPAAQPSLKGMQPEEVSAAPERGAEAGAATERLDLGWDESRWVGDAESSAAEQPLSRQDLLVEPEVVDTLCPHCPSLPPLGYSLNLRPLWLHACRYSCEDWSYECPPPLWAQESWEPPLSLLLSPSIESPEPNPAT